MRFRCRNSGNKSYKNYGGRGITICPRWEVFLNFLEDMGECPSGLTLERTDNNGGYCPENCKWDTRTTQSRNRRNVLTWNEVKVIRDACAGGIKPIYVARRFEINLTTVYRIINGTIWA